MDNENILTTILRTSNARLSLGNVWLVTEGDMWIVYKRKPYAKHTSILIVTPDLEEAARVLLREGGL